MKNTYGNSVAVTLFGESHGEYIGAVIDGLAPGIEINHTYIAQMLFSIPAVKGVEFGAGFAMVDMRGSEANDPITMVNGKVMTATNNNGGINGGITNGMPIIFRTAVKPTPTIFKPQNTIDFKTMTQTVLEPKGRHDPAIVHRARVVQDAVSAIVLCDALSMRFGTDFLNHL